MQKGIPIVTSKNIFAPLAPTSQEIHIMLPRQIPQASCTRSHLRTFPQSLVSFPPGVEDQFPASKVVNLLFIVKFTLVPPTPLPSNYLYRCLLAISTTGLFNRFFRSIHSFWFAEEELQPGLMAIWHRGQHKQRLNYISESGWDSIVEQVKGSGLFEPKMSCTVSWLFFPLFSAGGIRFYTSLWSLLLSIECRPLSTSWFPTMWRNFAMCFSVHTLTTMMG